VPRGEGWTGRPRGVKGRRAGGFALAKRQGVFQTARMDTQSQSAQYAPVLMLVLLAVLFAGGTLVLSMIVGKLANRNRLGRPPRVKNIPYECGMLPVGEGSTRLSVRFHLVAMLFILFDLEVVFLYPWAVVYRDMLRDHAGLIFGSMASFLGVLWVGYIYALRKKAFDWKS
jgi:NADH-quinone oxidoreductase subunit A